MGIHLSLNFEKVDMKYRFFKALIAVHHIFTLLVLSYFVYPIISHTTTAYLNNDLDYAVIYFNDHMTKPYLVDPIELSLMISMSSFIFICVIQYIAIGQWRPYFLFKKVSI
ncbi:hypothetical protein GCM10010982_05730 [Bowmanella pacifica]|uniref:Uncharacterized protein n=1 Tax=Bowmanella pacifica TaxID=502051 RepID=A0A917YSH0_9ALTE|nr:hypothetical protein GCM10010982_05730 [Bowmanella pacifica]